MSARHLMTFLAGTALSLILVSHSGPVRAMSDEANAASDRSGVSDAAASAPAASAPAASNAPDAAQSATNAAPASPSAPPADVATAPSAAPQAPAAPEVTAASAAAAAAEAANQALREALNGLATGKFDRVLGGKKERTEIEAVYAAREFKPLWIENGMLNDRAKAAVAYLGSVDAHGLDPSDYPVPQINAGADSAGLADAEMRLTASLLTFAKHAQYGRTHYSRIAADIAYTRPVFDPGEALGKIAASTDLKEALDGFNPQQPGYKALKRKLAEARGRGAEKAPERIPHGATLKVGMTDSRAPLVRERLGLPAAEGTAYDKSLSDAVKAFQKKNKIAASGQLNGPTVAAINGPSRARDADTIIANMERWRWMPRDLGATHVMVNIPDYTLKVMKNGATVWSTRIVVGKPGKLATPITTAAMSHVTVNPTWNVPPSIIENEYLPALAQDPSALDRLGLKLTHRPDGTIHIYQPPGERNALGRLRFNFPNKFLVYQHDTPDKHLFAHDKRAYSHGCMRVQDPLKYGEVLLSLALPNQGWSQDRLRKMFGTAEHDIRLPTAIPVHMTYQTAFVDDGGKLVIRDDIYGHDSRTLAVLNGDRRVADIPMDRPATTSTKPVRPPAGMAFANNGGFGGSNFFDRIFGGPQPLPPAPVQRRTQRW